MSASVGLGEHFKRLFDFDGREDRASFWPYAALAFGLVMVLGMIVFIPIMFSSIGAMQEFAAQHPEQMTVTNGPGSYSISANGNHPAFMPAAPMAVFLATNFGMMILLYAAAMVRRLHDGGKSGFWGLIPLPFTVYSSVMMLQMFASFGSDTEPNMTLFFSIFFSNMLYLVALIWLIVLLASPSKPASNP